MFNNKVTKNFQIAYLLMRLTLGLNLLAHGLVRLPKLQEFSHWMITLFQESLLPPFLVTPFSYLLPPLEFLIGALLVLGFRTQQSLYAAALVMMSLVFGSCLIEKWEMAEGQMVYALIIFVLSATISNNKYSVDQYFSHGEKDHV